MTQGKQTSWRTGGGSSGGAGPQPALKGRLQQMRGKKRKWMVELRSTMKDNRALLERMLEERSQPQSRREALIRFVPDTLRSLSEEDEYKVMHDQYLVDIVHPRRHTRSSTSGGWTGPQQPTTHSRHSTSNSHAITPPTKAASYFHMPRCPSRQLASMVRGQLSPAVTVLQPLTTPVRSRDIGGNQSEKVLGSSLRRTGTYPQYPPRLNVSLTWMTCVIY
ncbi:hypothetical protein GWK47_051850 [Chionoecetes opilio]|uniref:Uncharacterized protein n=1 Tax=Chionoecetes opilio TaxID=41210 RepID=A0A8J4Y7P4_CHIOP|nr:hypothetical protein GWK47_051850 [Chionoecetes opilio]